MSHLSRLALGLIFLATSLSARPPAGHRVDGICQDGSPVPTRQARYSILSGTMRIDGGATRPADLSAASVYATTSP